MRASLIVSTLVIGIAASSCEYLRPTRAGSSPRAASGREESVSPVPASGTTGTTGTATPSSAPESAVSAQPVPALPEAPATPPDELLAAAIREYNAGKPTDAKKTLEQALEATRADELAETRAVVHFHLAAVAYDFGELRQTDKHLRECLKLRPYYAPDWKYFAPGLRKRYEDLK